MKIPKANAIVEYLHQVLGNMLRVQLTKQHDKDDPVKELTSAAAFVIRSTVHGVTGFYSRPCSLQQECDDSHSCAT